jgi:dienelactone hydrolase
VIPLASGAVMRRTGPEGGLPVVCLNGGTARPQPGDWSSSIEWLVRRLAPRHPEIAFHEVRYRVKSWKELDSCIADGRAALEAATGDAGRPALLIGFSMGGAVAIAVAGHPAVTGVVGLAPWIPDRLDLAPLRGRRLAVIQGGLDGSLPGIPGVSPAGSRAGAERARAAGIPVTYTLIRGALHPIALRPFGGRPVPAPRARAWARLLSAELDRFRGQASG